MRHPDRSLWAATVKTETVRIVQGDGQMTGAEVYGEIAKVLVIEGALQVSEYTISHVETFHTFVDRGIASGGDVYGECEVGDNDTSGKIGRSSHDPGATMGTCSGGRRHCALCKRPVREGH
jgi:hypothetical protein